MPDFLQRVRRQSLFGWILTVGMFVSCEIPLNNKLSGEQDDRVFTLAEQIIAAMPERIKVRFTFFLLACQGVLLLGKGLLISTTPGLVPYQASP